MRGGPKSAAVALLAAAALLAGCSAGGDAEDAGRAAAQSPAGQETEGPVAGPEERDAEERGGDTDASGPADGTAPPGASSPEPGPADGTRSFTDEEQEFLADRVPEGADPGALLELGTEACERIGYLRRHDRPGAVEALRDGEIPHAEDAVTHLCPQYADLLKDARKDS